MLAQANWLALAASRRLAGLQAAAAAESRCVNVEGGASSLCGTDSDGIMVPTKLEALQDSVLAIRTGLVCRHTSSLFLQKLSKVHRESQGPPAAGSKGSLGNSPDPSPSAGGPPHSKLSQSSPMDTFIGLRLKPHCQCWELCAQEHRLSRLSILNASSKLA